MRLVRPLMLAVALAATVVVASGGPNSTYTLKCPGCAAIIAAAASPDGASVVVGGNNAFALLDVAKQNFSWSMNFVDYGSEQEGPFAWADKNLFAGMAPDSGTTETVWAIDATNGNNTWSAGDDGSMSQVSLTSIPGAFFSASVTANAVERLDAKTGKKGWSVQLNDYVFNMIAGRLTKPNKTFASDVDPTDKFAIVVACGSVAYAYDSDNGDQLWASSSLDTQVAVMAIDEANQVAYFAGATDPDGNDLDYSTVYAFDYVTGASKWAVNVTGGVKLTTFLQAKGDSVFAYTTSGVWAFDAKDGHSRWNRTLYTPTSNQVPAATPGRWNATAVLFASVTGADLTAIRTDNGQALWTVPLGQGVLASLSPVILEQSHQLLVPVATSDNNHGFISSFAMPQ